MGTSYSYKTEYSGLENTLQQTKKINSCFVVNFLESQNSHYNTGNGVNKAPNKPTHFASIHLVKRAIFDFSAVNKLTPQGSGN